MPKRLMFLLDDRDGTVIAASIDERDEYHMDVIPVETSWYIAGATWEWLSTLTPATPAQYGDLKDKLEEIYQTRIEVVEKEEGVYYG